MAVSTFLLVFILIMLTMSAFLSPASRLLPLLEDLPVHAVGLHFRHIVSLSWLSRVQLTAQISPGVSVGSGLFFFHELRFQHCEDNYTKGIFNLQSRF